jgi:hypothetical protein
MTINEPVESFPEAPLNAESLESRVAAESVPEPALAPPKGPVGFALAALLVGIGAFLLGLIPVFGALVGVTAIVLGVLALRRRQVKGMAVVGIALGSIAVIASIAMTIGIGAAVNNASSQTPIVRETQPVVDPSVEESATPPTKDTATPTPSIAPEPEMPSVPAEYLSALIKATSYSELAHMSKAGLYDQLTSEYGEKFSPEAAQYGIDNVQADWNANALAKAKTYQEQMAMSPEGIRDQLTSEYGEKFTADEAAYAILHLND